MSRTLLIWCVAAPLWVIVGCSQPKPNPWVYYPAPPDSPRAVLIARFDSMNEVCPTRSTFLDFLRGNPIVPQVSNPAGIAWSPDGVAYICDATDGAIHRWDFQRREALRMDAGGKLEYPVAVAVDASGGIFVADTGLGYVMQWTHTGQVVAEFKPPNRENYRPVALALSGNSLFVADVANHLVDVYDIQTHALLRSWGGPDAEEETQRLFCPAGLAIANDELFVSEMLDGRVQVFGLDGSYRRTISQKGDRYGDLGMPKQIAIGPDGILFITDAQYQCIHLFDLEGRLLMLLGGPTYSNHVHENPAALPLGIAVINPIPPILAKMIPQDFDSSQAILVGNTIGNRKLSLFVIGKQR